MANKSGSGRLVYADLLRVAASLAVVVLHVAGSQMYAVPVSSPQWQVLNLWDGLVRWCVPVFVMLSGMFLLDPSRPYRLLTHCVRPAVCLLLYGVLYNWYDRDCPLTWSGLRDSFLSLCRGELHYHLWFLPMLLGLYLLAPVLRAFCKGASDKDFLWFFLLTFLFASLLPTAFALWPGRTAPLRVWYSHFQLQSLLGYGGYFLAGYWLRSRSLHLPAKLLCLLLGILGGLVTVLGTASLSQKAGGMIDTLYGYFAPNVVLFAVGVVALFGLLWEKANPVGFFSGAAKLSLGVYLLHDLLLQTLLKHGITPLSFPPVWAVPLLALGIFLTALAASWLLSKLPLAGKWLT